MALIFLAPANDCIGRGILYQKASGVMTRFHNIHSLYFADFK